MTSRDVSFSIPNEEEIPEPTESNMFTIPQQLWKPYQRQKVTLPDNFAPGDQWNKAPGDNGFKDYGLPAYMDPRNGDVQEIIGHTNTDADLLETFNKLNGTNLSPKDMDEIFGTSDQQKGYARQWLIKGITEKASSVNIGGFTSKTGMKDLTKLILDMKRDITRVKQAISPAGAQYMVDKHNSKAKPGARWFLNKKDQNGPAEISNMSDINNDGIPDVVIYNNRGQPLYVNGYTTTISKFPHDLAYYQQFPLRKQRSKNPKNEWLKTQFHGLSYVDKDAEHPENIGNVSTYRRGFPDFVTTSGYAVHTPKRLSPYKRFRKYLMDKDLILKQACLPIAQLPAETKLPIIAKAIAHLWKTFYIGKVLSDHGINPETASETTIAKAKKDYKDMLDMLVTDDIRKLYYSEKAESDSFKDHIIGILKDAITTYCTNMNIPYNKNV